MDLNKDGRISEIVNLLASPEKLIENFSDHKTVVYMAFNDATKDYYFGMTSDKDKRIGAHIRALKNGTHINPKFQKSYDIDSNFNFISLPVIDVTVASEIEKILIKECKNDTHCLNIKDAIPPPSLGRKAKPEEIEKMKKFQSERFKNPNELEKRSNLTKELWTRPDYRETQIKRMIGNTITAGRIATDEEKKKRSENTIRGYQNGRVPGMLGKSMSVETKNKMSLAKSGVVLSSETKNKIREKHIQSHGTKVIIDGIVYSDITTASNILNIPKSNIRRWANSADDKYRNYSVIK